MEKTKLPAFVTIDPYLQVARARMIDAEGNEQERRGIIPIAMCSRNGWSFKSLKCKPEHFEKMKEHGVILKAV